MKTQGLTGSNGLPVRQKDSDIFIGHSPMAPNAKQNMWNSTKGCLMIFYFIPMAGGGGGGGGGGGKSEVPSLRSQCGLTGTSLASFDLKMIGT